MDTIERARWAITGAAGTIGTLLRTALQERGIPTLSIDIADLVPLGKHDQVARVDLADLEALVDCLSGCGGVIHLGAIADEADFHDLAEVNIVGTYHVLEAARRAGVARVVFASSNRLTGMYEIQTDVSVDLPPRPDGFYGVSKVAGEALCRLYADKFGVSTISVRIGSFGERPSSPREQRTWLSPDDAVRAFLAAMTTSEHTATFYAVSANAGRWWNDEAGIALGFVPVDDASTFGPLEPLAPGTLQSGVYTEPDQSISRMRR